MFFIGVSQKDLGVSVIKKLLERGYYTNLGVFPAVSLKNTGIRFTITRSHTKEQINQFLQDLKALLEEEMLMFDFGLDQIYKAFRKQLMLQNKIVTSGVQQSSNQFLQGNDCVSNRSSKNPVFSSLSVNNTN